MKAVWLAFGLVVGAFTVITAHDVLIVFFAGIVFAVPLRAAACALARLTRAPVGLALGLVVALLATLAAGILWLWELLVAQQAQQLILALPGALRSLAHIVQTEPWASRLSGNLPDPSALLTGVGGVAGALRGVAGGTFTALLDCAIVLFAAICFAAEPRTYVDGLLRLVPPRERGRVDAAFAEAAVTIRRWLVARAISMLVVGALVGLGLSILGMPDALALAILAALFAFVPNVGAIAAALPSLLLAVPFGWQRVLLVVLLYWVAHSLDDYLVIPFAERRVVRLPPVLTIAAQLVLGLAAGVLGIMMAAPFVALTIVFVHRLVVQARIERRSIAAS